MPMYGSGASPAPAPPTGSGGSVPGAYNPMFDKSKPPGPDYEWTANGWQKKAGPGPAAPAPTALPGAATGASTGVAPAAASPAMAGITNVVNGQQDPAKGWRPDQGVAGGAGALGTRTPSVAMDALRRIVMSRGRLY